MRNTLAPRLLPAALFLLFLGCDAAARAQDLDVKPDPGLRVGIVTSSLSGKWLIIKPDPLKLIAPTVLDGGRAIYFQAPPGSYVAIQIPPGETQPLFAVVDLGAHVDPPPPPPPPPGERWGIILRESKQQTAALAKLLQELRQELDGSKLRIVDPDNLPPDWAPFVRVVHESGHKLPVLAVINSDRSVAKVIPLPDTAAAIKRELGL